jgi:hypothetical protein
MIRAAIRRIGSRTKAAYYMQLPICFLGEEYGFQEGNEFCNSNTNFKEKDISLQLQASSEMFIYG